MDGRTATAAALADFQPEDPVRVLAIGKAATAMLAGAADALGTALGECLVVTRPDTVRPADEAPDGAKILFGDHPIPGPRSFEAGVRVAAFCDAVPAGGEILVLLSGGASSLLELLPAGVSPERLEAAGRWLLASGLDIRAVNAVRGRLSCLKAGRLAARLDGRRVRALAVSDVPGDEPAVIGSGPLTPGPRPEWPAGVPQWILRLAGEFPAAPEPGDPGVARVDYRVIANSSMAAAAAVAEAGRRGVDAVLHKPLLEGPVNAAARRILAELDADSGRVHVWHGETTVDLPPQPGRGGRNRHLALTLARGLAGREHVTALCATTDGSDGDPDAAGGWADGATVSRGRQAGMDDSRCLAMADAGTFIEAAGDAFVTGPTGTNVMDLVLAATGGGLCGARRDG